MEGLVKLAFYCFTAASLAVFASAVCYLVYGIGRIRVQRQVLTTPTGERITSTSAELGPGSIGAGRFGTLLAGFALVLAFFSVIARVGATKRGPYSNMYEFSIAFIFAILLMYLLFERSYKTKQLGSIVLPITAGMALYVWSLPSSLRESTHLIPALQNNLLMTIHVSSAIFAYAAASVSFAAAVFFLIQLRKNVSWLPSAEMLDDVGYRAVTIGFPLLSLTLILGSVWAHEAWGSYWSWDPKETSCLFTWLIYAIYLHTRSLRGWRGRRSAMILIVGFIAVMFTYYGNYFFGGLHAYGGV